MTAVGAGAIRPRSAVASSALRRNSAYLAGLSPAAILLALYIGLRMTLLLGAVMYLGALLIAKLQWNKATPQVRGAAVEPVTS